MEWSFLIAASVMALAIPGVAWADDADAFPGYGDAARGPVKTRQGCGYEEWTVTATRVAGHKEGEFTRADEYTAREVACDQLPAKTSAPRALIAALKRADTPIARDARIVQLGKIQASVDDRDERVTYRQAVLRIYSKEMTLSLGRCEEMDRNVLCGAMIATRCLSPLGTSHDRACVAWAIDEQSHLLERARLHRAAGRDKACTELATSVRSAATRAGEAFDKMRGDYTWEKGSLRFKVLTGEILDEEATSRRFQELATAAQSACKGS